MPIKIRVTSTFDSGGGPEEISEQYQVETWPEMVKVLIEVHADAPVLPDHIEIEYEP
jgi:hypothetical protein